MKTSNFLNETKLFSVRIFWLPWDYIFRQKTIPLRKTIALLSTNLTYDPLRQQCYNFCGWAIPGLLLLIVVDLQLSQTETLFPQMLRNKSLQIFWLNKGRNKVQKKELTERLAGFLDDWSCCWVKTRPANVITFNREISAKILLEDGNWNTAIYFGNL